MSDSLAVHTPPRRRWRGVVAGAAVVVGAYLVGAPATVIAAPPGYVLLTTPSVVVKNMTLAPGKAIDKLIIGGKTTVPSAANSVAVTVAVSGGTAAGSITVSPRENEAAAVAAVSWSAEQSKSAEIALRPGTKNMATFVNNSTGTVVLTVTITAYSLQGAPGPQGPPGADGAPGPGAGGFSVSPTMVSSASEPAGTTVLTYGPFTFKVACWQTAAGTGNAILRVTGSQTFSLQEVIWARLGNGTYSGGPAEGSGLGSAVVELISGTNISGDSYIDPAFLAVGSGANATIYRLSAHVFEDAPNEKCLIQGTIFQATP